MSGKTNTHARTRILIVHLHRCAQHYKPPPVSLVSGTIILEFVSEKACELNCASPYWNLTQAKE
uniref:Uncharacterized protein n=1 Tax=Lepeophtheirus salmonis TaxID=72036 RepID=A0A0K2V3F7_LEPSM